MIQDIRFAKNKQIYASRDAAVQAIKTTVRHYAGMPLLHIYYTTGGSTSGIITVGIKDGTGEDAYKILADEVEVKNQLVYSNDEPIVSGIGSIKPGDTFDNVPMDEMLTKILYPYVAPTISLNCTPAGGLKHIGQTVSSVVANAMVTKRSQKITSVKFFKNNVEIKDDTEPVTSGSVTKTCEVGTISSTTSIRAEVYDESGTKVNSNTVAYTFVNPYYIGLLDNSVTEPTAAQIIGMTEVLASPGNFSKVFASIANQKVCVALPAPWEIKSVIDPNGFDITASYKKTSVSVTTKTGKTTATYNVYLSDAFSGQNFKITYNKA